MPPTGCVVRAVWLTMGVLAWSQSDSVSGFQGEGSKSLGERHSSRLLELVGIASRLNQHHLERRKRLVADDDPVINKRDAAPSSDQLVGRESSNVQSPYVRRRREADDGSSAWDDLYNTYVAFHGDLNTFINDLMTKLKPDSPPELEYMKIIPDIMPTDDPDFIYHNEDSMVERVYNIMGFTARLIQGARQYVTDTSWFDNQADLLGNWIGLVQLNIVDLRWAGEEESFEFIKAGLGDISTGPDQYREVNMDHLKALLGVI